MSARHLLFTRRPASALSHEEYFIGAFESQFPGAEWISPPPLEEGPDSRPPDTSVGPVTVAFVGSKSYDTKELERWVRSLPQDTIIVTGDGIGAEKKVRELAEEFSIRVDVPSLNRELFGTKAMDAQVGSILSFTSGDVVTAGKGTRVTKVKRWYERARWGREWIQI